MTLIDLRNREMRLHQIVTSLQGTMEEKSRQLELLGVFNEYKEIHKAYARLHKHDAEALKRGLFLTWYSSIEPPCFTGIKDLDAYAEDKIMRTLNRRLRQNVSDHEMEWMLSYYANWNYLFERFKQYDALKNKLKRSTEELPSHIDKQDMALRGQMGLYWTSLNTFK